MARPDAGQTAVRRVSLARSVGAQVTAEVRARLRTQATLFVGLGLFVASFLWIPRPGSGWYSIAWTNARGELETGRYSASFLGLSAAILTSCFLTLIGFYLVAGSVRRDRERGVGAILAATPLSRTAYLTGKLAAHTAYLLVLAGLALAAAAAVWLRDGEGPFSLLELALPVLVLVPPGLVLAAALALLFDVVPGLSGPGGWVLYFFVWAFGFLVLPGFLFGGFGTGPPPTGVAFFDPVGLASFGRLLSEAVPNGWGGELNLGLAQVPGPVTRVELPAFRPNLDLVTGRAASLALALLPLLPAIAFFDRFDPARGRQRRRTAAAPAAAAPSEATPFVRLEPHQLAPVAVRPSAWRAVLAEARLLVGLAPRWRWPVLAAALVAAVPGPAGRLPAAVFLLLAAVLVAEAASRELAAGTRALVLVQPAVPRSTVLWKLGAVGLVLGVLGLPGLVGALLSGGALAGLCWLGGLGFLATFAVGAGVLSGGGRLFIGLFTAVWYAALNSGGGPFDFTGRFGAVAQPGVVLGFLAFGAALVALAWLGERRAVL